MSELICTCHCGGTMFYRHLHASDCPCATAGDEAPDSHPDTIAALRARLVVAEQQNETYKKQFAILNESVHSHYEEKIAAQKRLAEAERVVRDYKLRYAALAELTATQGRHLAAIQATVGDTEFALREQVARLERERDSRTETHRAIVEMKDTDIAQLQATLAAREARIAELVEGLRTIAYADWSPELNKEISAAMERGELKHMTGVEWLAQRLLTQLEAHRKEG